MKTNLVKKIECLSRSGHRATVGAIKCCTPKSWNLSHRLSNPRGTGCVEQVVLQLLLTLLNKCESNRKVHIHEIETLCVGR